MAEGESLETMVRRLVDDPEYALQLTARIEARAEEPGVINALVAYARSRQATRGQAAARRILTAAGVSWEAL